MDHVSNDYTQAYEEAVAWWVERRTAMAGPWIVEE